MQHYLINCSWIYVFAIFHRRNVKLETLKLEKKSLNPLQETTHKGFMTDIDTWCSKVACAWAAKHINIIWEQTAVLTNRLMCVVTALNARALGAPRFSKVQIP